MHLFSRPRRPILFAALTALCLAVAAAGPAAHAQDDTTVTIQYNGDEDPTNAPNTVSGEGPVGGIVPVDVPQDNYIAPGGVQTGESLIGTVQEDPNIFLFVNFFNRTDLAPQFQLGVPADFQNVTFSLVPIVSGPGAGIRFVTGGVNAGGGFDSANVVDDFNVVFFNRSGAPLRPRDSFTAFLQIAAPDPGPDQSYSFTINTRPLAVIPEPGTLALAASVGLPLLSVGCRRGAVRRRRRERAAA